MTSLSRVFKTEQQAQAFQTVAREEFHRLRDAGCATSDALQMADVLALMHYVDAPHSADALRAKLHSTERWQMLAELPRIRRALLSWLTNKQFVRLPAECFFPMNEQRKAS